jgi:hypothetical protein
MKTPRPTLKSRAPKAAHPARHAHRRPAIDYPKDAERVESPFYTFRVSAPNARAVSVAVDQGAWRECREAVGYWWFDWSPECSGEHELIACALHPDGRETVSEIVHFFS